MAKNFDSNPAFEDSEQGVNGADLAPPFRYLIEKYCERMPNGNFLGLGAGGAKSEIALAQMLDMNSITLVDNHPVKIPGFQGEYLRDDILDFMLSYNEAKFGLITAFGIEYLLESRSKWAKFWNGVGRITKPGSIVAISPYEGLQVPEESFNVVYADLGSFFIAQRSY